jgi:hypothetical protein
MLFDPVPELSIQHWKIADNDRPDDGQAEAEIFMNSAIAQAIKRRPINCRPVLLDLNRNCPGSLANDLQIAHHGIYGATVCSIHGAT